ncbi:MAG: hypothetical protein EXR98_15965 [Gemmataceae bacterium]|nr:hypothetical protein [Gemmataceae bacterium]
MASQVLSAPEKHDPNRPSIDCRVYERQSCEMPATCQPASALAMKEMRWSATILDISRGGLRVRLQRHFERGTGLAVELPGDAQREPCVVFVKVVHVKAQDDGTWALGCKFISELSDDEVLRLVSSDQYALSSTKDNKEDEASEEADEFEADDKPAESAPITVTVLNDVAIEIEAGQGTPIRCWIKRLDVSKCWPMTPGNRLTIGGKARDGTEWSIKIEVIEPSTHAQGWRLRTRLMRSADASGLLRVLERFDASR